MLRGFAGGALQPGVFALDETQMLERVENDLRELLGISDRPVFAEVAKWKNSMPQYEVGHLDRVQSIENAVAQLPNLTLAGNCNGGAIDSYLKIVEGNGLLGNKVDLAVGFAGNPSLAGANTVHLAAGTRLNMVAGHKGADVNCGATLGATLVSADA